MPVPRSPNWQRALVVLSGVTVAVVATAALYWAQKVLVPVALAVFIAFLLSPLVTRLQRRGLPRSVAVILVVLVAVIVGGGTLWLISAQLHELAAGMPQYTANIKVRIRDLREMGKDSVLDRLNAMGKELGDVWSKPNAKDTAAPDAKDAAAPQPEAAKKAPKAAPEKVVIEPGPSWVSNILPTVPWLVEILASGALAMVLAVFMLLKREDLRNRVIWLTGGSRVVLTTKALDDIGHRISRYLLAQLAINGSYGIALAAGLSVIGVGHWLLWGVLGGLLRYLPYIGAPIAAIFPIALSLAQLPGWTPPLQVIGWIVLLELLASNVLEPWLFGKTIGVSEVALLVAAGFWTFLWGPVGLVLSGPLTVCLLVVGQYVPSLRFVAVILGDEPALEPDIMLFQRLAAGDQDEAMAIVTSYVQKHTVEQVYDGLLVPVLSHLRIALQEGELNEGDEQFIRETMQVILEELDVQEPVRASKPSAEAEPFQPPRNRVRIVCCAARDDLDQLSLTMLKQLLDPLRWEVIVVPVTLLAGELLALIDDKNPTALCVGSLPPGGLAHTRYLCKRLRARFPELKLLAGRWGGTAPEPEQESLHAAGADQIDTTLLAARDQLLEWLPVLQEQTPPDAAAGSASPPMPLLQKV